MSTFILSQIIAGGALTAALLTFQFKKNSHILVAFAIMSSLISLHLYVLGQYAAAAVVAVSVVRFIASVYSKHWLMMWFFLALTSLVGWYTYREWFNLIAILAGLLGVVATFQTQDKRLRVTMMSSSFTMAVHDFVVMTPVGILVDLTVLFSGILGYYRYHVRGVSTRPEDSGR